MGKVWQSVLDVGKVKGEVWGVWESAGERCGKVSWGMEKGELANLWGCGEVLGKAWESVLECMCVGM